MLGFDYEGWLLQQGVRATGYVRTPGVRLDPFVFSVGAVIESSRVVLRDRIVRALPHQQYAGVIVALVVGDQRAIEQSDWAVFNRTGIGHLISISGLHITMVAGGFAWVASFLWRRSFFTGAQLPLRLPAQKVAVLAGAGVALLYVLVAGFGIPAQRTLYMLAVVAAAAWLERLTRVSHVLCLALGAVVLLDPWAVLSPGFWLSFGAVAVILYASVGRVVPRDGGWRGAMRSAARTQYAVTVGLVPLTMLLFAQVSLVSPIANAVAIPVISLAVTPLALVGSVLPSFPGDYLLRLAHALVALLAEGLAPLAGPRLAVWSAPAPSGWVFAFALAGTLWLLAPRGWPLRWSGLVAWLPLLLARPTNPPPGELAVTAFDVGQGTALLIETSGHRLLYDTGPRYARDADAGNRVILPYLKGRGIDRLDTLVVSHSDTDHAGGALSVLDQIRTGFLLSSLPESHPVVRRSLMHALCVAGQRWIWDGVQFEMLHPSPGSYDYPGIKPNARSCTLRIRAGKHSILLAGDIEAAQEAGLLAAGAPLEATVLLAPHHGSGTSSSTAFLAAVRPAIAVFQVGYRNRYGHPKAEVYDRYGARNIERLRTDDTGAIRLSFGSSVKVERYRETNRRYWFGD